jgi:hypothetical protein
MAGQVTPFLINERKKEIKLSNKRKFLRAGVDAESSVAHLLFVL